MAIVECKECGGQISQNADTRPHCGDVINERKQKFCLVDLIHKISVPVVLSVAGTLITILTYFSMEGERQMEQTRKLLADAFDKDPIKQQYCIFYIDHLLASGLISAQMTVSVLNDCCRECNQRQRPARCASNDAGPARAKELSRRAQAFSCAEDFQPDPQSDRS